MYSKEEIENFVKKIDMFPLFNEVCKRLGVPALSFEKKIKYKHDKPYIWCRSENLAEDCGVLGYVFDELYVEHFSSDVDEEKLTYFISLHFAWHMYNGGENGCRLFSAKYKDGNWEIFD